MSKLAKSKTVIAENMKYLFKICTHKYSHKKTAFPLNKMLKYKDLRMMFCIGKVLGTYCLFAKAALFG